MQPEARILRHVVVKWLIDTTGDFASASMDPKQSTTFDLSDTFQLTRCWGESRQPYLIFNSNGSGSVSPLWMEPESAASSEHLTLLKQLSCHTCNSGRGTAKHNCTIPRLSEFNEGLGYFLLSILFGVSEDQIKNAATRRTSSSPSSSSSLSSSSPIPTPSSSYVLTLDNFLKIVAIHFRVKAGIPVVIMVCILVHHLVRLTWLIILIAQGRKWLRKDAAHRVPVRLPGLTFGET